MLGVSIVNSLRRRRQWLGPFTSRSLTRKNSGEKKKASARELYNAQPAKKNAADRATYRLNCEKRRTAVKACYIANPERKRALARAAYRTQPEKGRLHVENTISLTTVPG